MRVSASSSQWQRQARTFLRRATDFFFPPVCVGCGRIGSLFCDGCQTQLAWVRPPLCDVCGRPLSRPIRICQKCQRERPPWQRIRAAVVHQGPVRKAIHEMKYEGMFAVAEPLAHLLAIGWEEWGWMTEIVIPVPLHPERERERGYNQANLLVQHFCREIGLNSDLMALQRVRHTRPQVGLDPTARRENVEGAFRAESARVAGKRILLLDDVFTTGATMTAASQALLDCGARQVAGICVARAAGPADKI